MYTLEVMLRGNPAPLAIQRKEENSALALYQQIVTAIKQSTPSIVELTCDKTGRQLSVLTQEIAAVQIAAKDGATQTLNRPGFVAGS